MLCQMSFNLARSENFVISKSTSRVLAGGRNVAN